jgi:hypothetical protein
MDMAERKNNKNQTQTTDELDHALEMALAKYTSVEPRVGLEERVLARLRTEPKQSPSRVWCQWAVAAGAVAVVAIALALSLSKHSQRVIAIHPPDKKEHEESGTKMATSNVSGVKEHGHIQIHKTGKHIPQTIAVAEADPKLDEFPSPQPLSEQEKILANYVAQFPKQATLIARLRTEALQQDQLERMRAEESGGSGAISNEQKSDTTER